jgi:MFS family permease
LTVHENPTAVALLSLAVGIVLADSAIVTLALPSMLREFDAEVSEVAWVLTGFNLVLALAAVPAARICARGGRGLRGGGGARHVRGGVGRRLAVVAAAPGSRSAEALDLLASWTATTAREQVSDEARHP